MANIKLPAHASVVVIGAVWSPGDGRVGPSDLCAALVKGAKSHGVQIFEDTGVLAILTKANKIVGLETSSGNIGCDAIALCTGLWSRENALKAGVGIPVWPCEHFYLLTNPFQAGRDFAIDWNSNFIGKQSLLALRDREPDSRMVSIILDDPEAVPLGNEPVYSDGKITGKTTSAAFGYRIAKPVALAQLKTSPGQSLANLSVEVDIARSKFSGIISLASAYDPEGHRMRSKIQDKT